MGWLSKLLGGAEVIPTPVRTYADWETNVLESDIPVIVDFWSPTCAPCRKLVPVLTKVATKHAGAVRVVEVDVSRVEREVLRGLSIRATPSILIFDNGEEFGRVTGFRPPGWFDEMIATEFSAQT